MHTISTTLHAFNTQQSPHHKSHPSGSCVIICCSTTTTKPLLILNSQQLKSYCLCQAAWVSAAAQPKSCCTVTWLHRPNRRVAGACRLVPPQPYSHALHLNITRPVMRSTKPLVKSAAAADTKPPGWHGQVLLVHSPATCRATTTHCRADHPLSQVSAPIQRQSTLPLIHHRRAKSPVASIVVHQLYTAPTVLWATSAPTLPLSHNTRNPPVHFPHSSLSTPPPASCLAICSHCNTGAVLLARTATRSSCTPTAVRHRH